MTEKICKIMMKKYSYLCISKENMIREINKIYKKYGKDNLEKNFNKEMSLYLNKLLNKKFMLIVNMYLNEKGNVFKLNDLFKEANFVPTINSYIEILNSNSEAKKTVKKEFDKILKDGKEIYDVELYKYDEGYNMMLMECYCILNNISINEKIDNNDKINELFFTMPLPKKNLTREEELELFYKVKNGDKEAKELFTKHYLKLVISIAVKYTRYNNEMKDLIQEGSLGLLKAIEKFNPDLGYRFSSYAYSWIRQYIGRYIHDKTRTIRLSNHASEIYIKAMKTKIQINNLEQREPSVEELANLLGVKEEKLELILKMGNPLSSLDKPIGEKRDSNLTDIIISDELTPEDKVIDEEIKTVAINEINKLNLKDVQKEIVKLLFCIEDNDYSVREIAEVFDVTDSYVRATGTKGLMMLRRNQELREILNIKRK